MDGRQNGNGVWIGLIVGCNLIHLNGYSPLRSWLGPLYTVLR